MEANFAVVESGVVTNIVVINTTDAETISRLNSVLIPEGSSAGIGWNFDGTNFSKVTTLADEQSAQLILIDSAYDAANTLPIAYLNTTFQADQDSQVLIASVLTACGGALPAGFVWYDANNSPVSMTFADLQGLAASILVRGQPLFYKKQQLKAAIRAATTVAQVEAITW